MKIFYIAGLHTAQNTKVSGFSPLTKIHRVKKLKLLTVMLENEQVAVVIC